MSADLPLIETTWNALQPFVREEKCQACECLQGALIELRLSLEDSPNSAGVAIDAVRCCKLGRDRKIGGPLTSISAYAMKHPPEQIPDREGRKKVEEFIQGLRER